MNKKTKISLNSTLIEVVMSKTIDIQEQDLGLDLGDSVRQAKEHKKECDACRAKALRLARKIVALDFENWTESDTEFYYENEEGLCCEWKEISDGMPGMIQHVEEGEPGWCENWLHCVLPVIEVGLLFIPGIGWGLALGLSMTVGLIDAALYYSEGEEETAGLVAFLTILPGVPSVVKKFPFVKAWAKQGTKKIAGKMISGEGLSLLERYQIKALSTESAQEFLELEVKQHMRELASKEFFGEAVEIGGKKITNEMIDNAIEKGYLKITIDGIESTLSKEMVEALTKSGKYTAIQQSKLISFGKTATPFILAGYGYMKIMEEMAKSGIRGPKKLIEKLWGIDPDDKAEIKISNFFRKVATGGEAEIDENIKTQWDYIKLMFNSSSSAKDNELMVQAIKKGWNPFEEDKTLVPKKYRTKGYKEWVNEILSNEKMLEWFVSDGSDEDNDLLLRLVFENPSFDNFESVPEKYQTDSYKEKKEQRRETEKSQTTTDDEGEESLDKTLLDLLNEE